jgi:LuxR family maltose regulon positive regulatory protein
MAHEGTATQPEESTTLIRTKLNRPRPGGDLVPRPRLVVSLECNPRRKLTLVSAPAGYGKTTLLVQWLEDCSYPSAWLSLDEGDSDPGVFLSYLIAAVRTAFPDACPTTEMLLRAPQSPPLDHLATVLINELAKFPETLILVLDDFHYVRDPSVHALLNTILRYLPEQVHLVIASRTDPPMALDRLRAGRQMLELRADDLRFSLEETQAYLETELGGELTPESIALLRQRTEGWIVGLHLAALWLHGTEDYAPILDGFQGDSARFVTEYLMAEVLAYQSPEVQDFLLRTSILDRFCARLCDALIDEGQRTEDARWTKEDEAPPSFALRHSSAAVGPPSPSQAILDELDRQNLFLVPLDYEHGWYRYHHLFRATLRQRLHTETRPDEVRTLHRQASQWLAGHGNVEEALRHALAADDIEAAVKLVEENSQDLLNRLERYTLERWLAMLPENVVGERPRLLVAQGWLFYRQWRLRALDAVLDAAEACLNAPGGAPATAEERATWGQIHTLRGVTAYMVHNDFQRSVASAERALDWLPTAEPGARSVALTFWAIAQQALGKKDTAIRQLQEALHAPAHLAPSKIQALIGLSFFHYLAADTHQLEQATDRLLALAAELNHSNAITGANWLSGLLRYEWNDLKAAAGHFSGLAEVYGSNFAATFNSTLGLARIYQVRGELDRAQGLFDDLRGETMRLDNTDLLPPVDALQACQWLLRGDVAPALSWARSFDSGQLEESIVWFEAPSQIRTRILSAHGTTAEVRTTVHDLDAKLKAAEARHNTRRVIQIQAHLALAYDRLGQTDDALTSLERAVVLAQPGGFIRSFVDAGPALRLLLRRLSQRGVAPDYLSQVLTAFDTVPQTESPPGTTPTPREAGTIDLLTSREEEILHLMGEGMTNQEIANELVISLYTVKRHATNIYNKLNVSNRRQAVLTARQLGVLPSK